jgi:hypothetical protein
VREKSGFSHERNVETKGVTVLSPPFERNERMRETPAREVI